MDSLRDGVTLYHGSYCVVDNVDLSKCYHGKDFGRGFYVTTSYEQAVRFVHLSVKNAVNTGILNQKQGYGFVNSYRFKCDNSIREFDFDRADRNWLHFVTGNRDDSLFAEMIDEFKEYNIIGGKIANDKTAATLNQYINGTFGTPGDEDADDIAIRLLLPNRLENQYCFRSDEAIASLEFLNAEEVAI